MVCSYPLLFGTIWGSAAIIEHLVDLAKQSFDKHESIYINERVEAGISLRVSD